MKLRAFDEQTNSSLRQTVIESYDEHYSDVGKLRDTEALYRWVLGHLIAARGTSTTDLTPQPLLVDVACGEGILVNAAADYGLHAYGVDFSPRATQTAQKMLKRNIISIADGEELPFGDCSVDYVTNVGSLEHFFSPAQGLQEMQRILRRQGLAALVLPNSYYLLDIIWHVWRSGYPVSHKQEIERFATAGEWRDLIEANGFRVLQTHKYNFLLPRTLPDLLWFLRRPLKFAYPLLSPVTPLNLSYHFLFICSPSKNS